MLENWFEHVGILQTMYKYTYMDPYETGLKEHHLPQLTCQGYIKKC
jgi:hypothetical protein